jgi:CRISPR-associated endonuclease/helicase Cas3
VHDIGKATPVFQARICSRAPYLLEKIENFGIEIMQISNFTDSTKTPHAYASEAILLDAGCPQGVAAVAGTLLLAEMDSCIAFDVRI